MAVGRTDNSRIAALRAQVIDAPADAQTERMDALVSARGGDCYGEYPAKRALDVLLSIPLIIVSIPLFLVLAAMVRLGSPGPAVFRQQRVGKGGRPFEMYKLRSLVASYPGDVGKPEPTDPGITRIGRILRKTSLDELPQLWNVLKGEMSLIGPRPETPESVAQYTSLHRYCLRGKPGMTGLWQVSEYRGEAPPHVHFEHDLYYLLHAGLLLDMRIFAWTATAVLRGDGAH